LASQQCRDLIQTLLKPNPSKRQSLEQILSHTWLCLCWNMNIRLIVLFS
jgi:serine/threonine protein kinase